MPNLITTPSNGSPILAYGSSSRPHNLRTRIIIIAIAAIALIGGIFVYLRFGAKIDLPAHRILTVAVMPKTAQSSLNGQLLAGLPLVWRTALDAHSRTPVLFGLALDAQTGSVKPFAVIPRFRTVVATEGVVVRSKGLTHLLTQDASQTESVRMRNLVLLRSVKSHHAAWAIDATALKTLLGLSADSQESDTIYGTWDGNRGSIHLDASQAGVPEQRVSDVLITLRGGGEEASPLISSLYAQGIDLRTITSAPQAIFMSSSGTRTIWDSVREQDLGYLYAGFGDPAVREFVIPDQSRATEFFAQTQGEASSTPLIFQTGDVDAQTTSVPPTACPGTPRLTVSGNALRNTLDLFQASEAWKTFFTSIRIHETDTGGVICVNE